MTRAAAKTELPRYVGYSEIAEATGIEKHTIQRLMKAGKFPKPDALPTKANRWRLSVVTTWLEQRNAEQIATLNDSAETDPSKLRDDQVGDAIQALGARLASLHGDKIAPEDIVGVTRKLTNDEREALQRNADAQLQERYDAIADAFARLDVIRAWLVVAGLLPSLRPAADRFLETIAGLRPAETPEEMRALAIDILDQALDGNFVNPTR